MGLFDIFRRKPSRDEFARLAMLRLKERGWPHELAYETAEFQLQLGDGGVLMLGNLYRDWLTYRDSERSAALDEALAIVFESDDDSSFEAAADHLMPLVRNLADLQVLALEAKGEPRLEIPQALRVLTGPLGIVLAMDRPKSLMMIESKTLHAWDCRFEAALERAVSNLAARSKAQFERARDGFFVSAYGDAYDSSRMLLPEIMRALPLRGDPVAVPVSRDCLVVAGEQDPKALDAMARFVVLRFRQETRPTGFQAYVLRGDEWRVFATESSVFSPMRDLAVKQSLWDYVPQTPALTAFYEAKGEDLFIAPLELAKHGSEAFTWTSWTEGVSALLPRAGAVGLTDRDGRIMMRAWHDVESVCGSFEEEPGYHPPRFRPPPWPAASAWARLEREFPAPDWWRPAPAARGRSTFGH